MTKLDIISAEDIRSYEKDLEQRAKAGNTLYVYYTELGETVPNHFLQGIYKGAIVPRRLPDKDAIELVAYDIGKLYEEAKDMSITLFGKSSKLAKMLAEYEPGLDGRIEAFGQPSGKETEPYGTNTGRVQEGTQQPAGSSMKAQAVKPEEPGGNASRQADIQAETEKPVNIQKAEMGTVQKTGAETKVQTGQQEVPAAKPEGKRSQEELPPVKRNPVVTQVPGTDSGNAGIHEDGIQGKEPAAEKKTGRKTVPARNGGQGEGSAAEPGKQDPGKEESGQTAQAEKEAKTELRKQSHDVQGTRPAGKPAGEAKPSGAQAGTGQGPRTSQASSRTAAGLAQSRTGKAQSNAEASPAKPATRTAAKPSDGEKPAAAVKAGQGVPMNDPAGVNDQKTKSTSFFEDKGESAGKGETVIIPTKKKVSRAAGDTDMPEQAKAGKETAGEAGKKAERGIKTGEKDNLKKEGNIKAGDSSKAEPEIKSEGNIKEDPEPKQDTGIKTNDNDKADGVKKPEGNLKETPETGAAGNSVLKANSVRNRIKARRMAAGMPVEVIAKGAEVMGNIQESAISTFKELVSSACSLTQPPPEAHIRGIIYALTRTPIDKETGKAKPDDYKKLLGLYLPEEAAESYYANTWEHLQRFTEFLKK